MTSGKKVYIRKGPPTAPHAELDAEIMRRIAEPEGMSSAKGIMGYRPAMVGDRCRKLRDAGRLFTARLGHRTVRHFATKEAAEAWTSGQTAPTIKTPDKAARFANAEADYSRAKITIIPHQPGRYEVRPQDCERAITNDWMIRRQVVQR